MVVYDSFASNLHPDDTDITFDVYLYNRHNDTLSLISRASATGAKGNKGSHGPSISADGRYVAYWSSATNLHPDGTDTISDIYVYDRHNDTLELISRANARGPTGNSNSFQASISADGRYVAYWSYATNLHPDDTDTHTDIYVYDRDNGTTELISRASASGPKANNYSSFASISADGRYVTYQSVATNLHPDDMDTHKDIYVYDRNGGTTELISRAGATGPTGNHDSDQPSISADGRYVAYRSEASNLHPDDADMGWDIYVYDRDNGTTELISRASATGPTGNHDSDQPSISADGRYVAYSSGSTNLHPDDDDANSDIFVYDRDNGTTTLMSRVGLNGVKGDGHSRNPTLSEDATLIAFMSGANNLDGEANVSYQVLVKETGHEPSSIPPANTAPTAVAGPDQTVEATGDGGARVTLDGSGSSDTDGSIVSHAWSWAGGGATGAGPTVGLPDGTTVVTLTVTDDDRAADTDMVSITVVNDSDLDDDGLTATQEADLGTDPLDPDSDNDGTLDGDEIAQGRDPLVNEPAPLIPIVQLLLGDQP